jgi:tetratricopeptide (TPR) repeat protein
LKDIIGNNLVSEEDFYGFFYDKLQIEKSEVFKNGVLDSVINAYFTVRENDLRIKSLYIDYLIEQQRYSEASDFIDDLININDEIFKFWYQKIFVEFNLKNFNKVTEYGDIAIKKFNNEVMPYYFSGVASQKMKNCGMAISYYSGGLNRTNRVDLMIQFNALIGDCYFEMEKFDKCFEHYEKAYSYDTLNLMVRNNYAFYLSEGNERLDKAEKLSKFTIEIEKKNFIYMDTYAWINYKMGNYLKAKRFINKAIRYGGDNDREILEHRNIIMNK